MEQGKVQTSPRAPHQMLELTNPSLDGKGGARCAESLGPSWGRQDPTPPQNSHSASDAHISHFVTLTKSPQLHEPPLPHFSVRGVISAFPIVKYSRVSNKLKYCTNIREDGD